MNVCVCVVFFLIEIRAFCEGQVIVVYNNVFCDGYFDDKSSASDKEMKIAGVLENACSSRTIEIRFWHWSCILIAANNRTG